MGAHTVGMPSILLYVSLRNDYLGNYFTSITYMEICLLVWRLVKADFSDSADLGFAHYDFEYGYLRYRT